MYKIKNCNKCQKEFPENSLYYHKNGKNKNNEIIYHNTCRSCRCTNVKNGEQFNKDIINDKNELYCIKCKKYLSKESFGIKNETKNLTRRGCSNICKQCTLIKSRNHSNKIKGTLKNALQVKITSIRKKVKTGKNYNKENIFDITYDDLLNLYNIQEGKCAISGITLTYNRSSTNIGHKINDNLSVDRIDSNKGYTKDNVQLVCTIINMMKNDLTQEQLEYYCKAIIKNNENKNN